MASGVNRDKNIERFKQLVGKKHTILLTVAGSELLGLGAKNSDQDYIGVFLEDIREFAGFSTADTLVWRSAEERTGDSAAKSQPGDIDLTLYGLRKYLRLALSGNPTLVQTLYAPDCMILTPEGKVLQDMKTEIVSRQAGKAFMGYLNAQRLRLSGSIGQRDVRRVDLEEKHGFDTKYAMHMVRLGLQGKQLMQKGFIELPMNSENKEFLVSIRKGSVSYDKCIQYALQYENGIKEYLDLKGGPLRQEPDYDAVEKWMIETYRKHWNQ